MTDYIQGVKRALGDSVGHVKADYIKELGGIELEITPDNLRTGDLVLVCVINHGAFESAPIVDTERDLIEFGNQFLTRWFVLPRAALERAITRS